MTRLHTTSLEESVNRSALSYLYGHPLALEVPTPRPASRHRRTPLRDRLPALRTGFGRARAGRRTVAEAGGCG